MTDLKAAKDKVLDAGRSGISIMTVITPPSIHPFSMISSAENVCDFIELSKSIGGRLLYFFEEDRKDDSGNQVPVRIELGFPYNGVVNVLIISEEPPSKVDITGSSRKGVSVTGPYDYLFNDMDKLVDSIVNYVSVNLDFMSPDSFNLRYFFKKFWMSKGLDTEKITGPLKDKVDEAEAKAMSAIKNQR